MERTLGSRELASSIVKSFITISDNQHHQADADQLDADEASFYLFER
jgi:hypothetical protein